MKNAAFIATIKWIVIIIGISLYLSRIEWLLFNFVSHMFILLTAFALFKPSRPGSGRAKAFSAALAAIFSVVLVVGQAIWNDNNMKDILGSFYGFMRNALKICGFYFLYEFPLFRFFSWLENTQFKFSGGKERAFFTVNKRSFFFQWAAIFLAWVPCLLAYWPGTLPYDAPGQVNSSLNFSNMTAHHPIIHTAFIGVFYRISIAFNNPELLPITYALGQMLIMSCIFSYAIYYMAKLKVPVWFRWISLAFYAFYPFNAIFSIVMTKDVLHGGATCLLFIALLSALLDPETFFRGIKKPLLFVLAGFFFTITRNNGLYALILSVPFLVAFFECHQNKVTVMLISIVALNLSYSTFLLTVMHVHEGPKKEAYPFLAQQLSYVVQQHEKSLSEKDKSDIYEILPRNAVDEYSPRYADPVKNFLNEDALKNPLKVIWVWARVGMKHPINYVEAFLANSMNFWYIDADINDPFVRRRYIETAFNTDFGVLYERKSKIPFLLDFYEQYAGFSGYIFPRTPLLVTVMSVAFPFCLLIISGGILLFRKSRLWITLIPLAALLFTVILGPLAYGRYIYPFIVLYPMIFAMLPPRGIEPKPLV